MISRLVRQIFPETNDKSAEPMRFFTDYGDARNIILLGEPGAGKSHLFRDRAEAGDGRFLSARSFLNIPPLERHEALFIDGLDEKRAGRGDLNTIDEMVRKLFAVNPAKVRISCRAQDWLGDTDLSAFNDYFDGNGGVVVLSLLPLTRTEQVEIVGSRAGQDAETFLKEAADRGLHEFLANPQNLPAAIRTW
jgi:predicted NACHT family NTPase